MTKYGLKIAIKNALSLPSFESLDQATYSLFQLRDKIYTEILNIEETLSKGLDFTPNSLKILERWYFELLNSDGFAGINIAREEFELYMGYYIGFVYTENDPDFTWVVEESPFAEKKYRIGVTKGLMTKIVGRVQHLEKLKNNKRQQSIFREYIQYA